MSPDDPMKGMNLNITEISSANPSTGTDGHQTTREHQNENETDRKQQNAGNLLRSQQRNLNQ